MIDQPAGAESPRAADRVGMNALHHGQLWRVSARLETKLGNVALARRSLLRAAELNSRSPLFGGLVDQLDPSN